MHRKSTASLRLKTTARQPGQAADRCRTARLGPSPDHDWRSRIVEGLVREQPHPATLGHSCRSTPRYRRRSWWLDTSTPAQSRRAVKRWHGCALGPLESQRRDRRLGALVGTGPSPCRGQARPQPGSASGRSSRSFHGCARPSGIGSGASMRTTGRKGESASLLLGVGWGPGLRI